LKRRDARVRAFTDDYAVSKIAIEDLGFWSLVGRKDEERVR